ncbi:hypothetical protein EYC84_001926 [Monilinia fructicola]|uniref:Uncharacterized protein n=1 Tax=Monilinia fructicola TaxID=38448 RepID=A0A5M9JTH6_MONFR|nr:hypothetical protein EYC84_001926 [Monilinia fructicola]
MPLCISDRGTMMEPGCKIKRHLNSHLWLDKPVMLRSIYPSTTCLLLTLPFLHNGSHLRLTMPSSSHSCLYLPRAFISGHMHVDLSNVIELGPHETFPTNQKRAVQGCRDASVPSASNLLL